MPRRPEELSPESHDEHVRGLFRLQSQSTYETPGRKRTASISPSGCQSVRGNDVYAQERTCEAGDAYESSDNSCRNSAQCQNNSSADDCSDGGNILSKMYASFGQESSHTKSRYLSTSKMKSIVKVEPNCDEYRTAAKRTKTHCSSELSSISGSHSRKSTATSPVHDSRRLFDSRISSPSQRDSVSRHNLSPGRNSHATSQRKRLNTRTNNDRHLVTKRRKLSSELPRNPTPDETDSPSEYTTASNQVHSQRGPSRPRRADDNNRVREIPFPIERNHPYIADQTPENILHLPNYSLMQERMNVMSSIGYQHDPNLLLKSASLGAGSMNPFFLGVNACVMNPFLMSSLEHSEIMAAAAYRQAIAAQILKTRMAGVKPLLGFGLVDPANSMYGGLSNTMYGNPESGHLANSIGNAIRFNSSDLPTNAHPARKTNHSGFVKETRKKPHVRPQESPDSYQPRIIHSSRIDPDEDLVKSNHHRHKRSQSPRRLPSIKDTFRRLSQPDMSENSLDADECDNYDSSGIGQHKNSLARTQVPATDFVTRKNFDQDIAPKHSVKLPLQLPHSVPAKSSDVTEEVRATYFENIFSDVTYSKNCNIQDETSLMDGKTFSRTSTYKNLTKERRLVANARERTRVHTISSAFEELRRQIPSYSCNQKLSKLAILRWVEVTTS